jgi:hypothetical protein
MNEVLTYQRESGVKTNQDRRLEPRADLRIPVEVCGFNRHSRFFSERTFTVNVSSGGCRLLLHAEVDEETILAVRLIQRRMGREIDTRPTLFQVVWLEGQANGWTLGASKVQSGIVWLNGIPGYGDAA